MPLPRRVLAVLVAGLVLVVAGVVLLVTAARSVSVGWFAYAPLAEATFSPGGMFVTPTHVWGAAVGGVGLVVVSGVAGYVLGRRGATTDGT